MRRKWASDASISTSYPQPYPQTCPHEPGGGVLWGTDPVTEHCALRRVLSNGDFRPRARDILISWAKAREYLDGETRYLKMADSACEPSVQDRFIAIARHYRSLATIEKSIADQRPNKSAHN